MTMRKSHVRASSIIRQSEGRYISEQKGGRLRSDPSAALPSISKPTPNINMYLEKVSNRSTGPAERHRYRKKKDGEKQW